MCNGLFTGDNEGGTSDTRSLGLLQDFSYMYWLFGEHQFQVII